MSEKSDTISNVESNYHERPIDHAGRSSRSWWRELGPRSRAGKVLAGAYAVALVAVALPLWGVAFDGARLWGPFPEAVTWTYLWYAVINAVLLGTYVLLLRPWANHADAFLGGSGEEASAADEEVR